MDDSIKNDNINTIWSVDQGPDNLIEKKFDNGDILHIHQTNEGIVTGANIRSSGDSKGVPISNYEASMLDLLPGTTKIIKGDKSSW